MEGNLAQGGIIQGGGGGGSFGGFDLPGSMRVNRQAQHTMNQHQAHPCQGPSVHSSIHDGFPLTMGTLQNCDQTISMNEFGQGDRNKHSASEEDEPEEGGDGHHQEGGRGKKGTPWQRVKWTDKMVRLLITAVSYIGEDGSSEGGGGGRRKFAVLQKKGKWKSISKVMAERGYRVSPQQCEDKFNDLNKRYKKLNDMLGRGTSCQVVENPALLDVIDFLNEKEKDDVRKILNSKHLFYEEMCSYHNCNRLHLPHDPALQRSLQIVLRNRDDHDNDDVRRSYHDDHDEDDHDMETDDHDEFEENFASHGDSRGIFGGLGGTTKRPRQGQGHEDPTTFGNPLNCQEYQKTSHPHGQTAQTDGNQALPENMRAAWLQKQWLDSRSVQLEEQKLQIQVEMLELEKQRFKWERFSKKQDRELEKFKLENDRMKIENERIALELKRKEIGGTSFN
ncbi:sequence-specific DNA binding transcription factor [Trifolium repens]|nr:sequence-specific DNA binding transcription factor [Trifolium repens]